MKTTLLVYQIIKYKISMNQSVRINLHLFPTVLPSNSSCFCPVGPFVVITTISTPRRPVDNVVITTEGLQDRNKNYLMEGRWEINVN